MWKWFIGFILVLFLLKALSSCSAFEMQPTKVDRPELMVVPVDQRPKLQQNGVDYKPKYVAPQASSEIHIETENEFEVLDKELMLNDQATD